MGMGMANSFAVSNATILHNATTAPVNCTAANLPLPNKMQMTGSGWRALRETRCGCGRASIKKDAVPAFLADAILCLQGQLGLQ
eukprot:5480291-Prymnesium_polylepis.1